MPDLRDRLIACFSAVFPSVPIDGKDLRPETVEGWDSVATVTLFAVIEEEFGIGIDIDELADVSFEGILQLLTLKQFGVSL